MTAVRKFAFDQVTSQGTSDAARFVAERGEQGRRRLQDSYTLGMGGKGVFAELGAVAEECHLPNWDGYEAAPIRDETYLLAYRFLDALPLGTPAPSVGAEPDGHLTLEWHRAPRRTLSVSVSPEGDLHYAALLGPRRAYGTEPFFGEVPKVILDLIRRVTAA